MSIGGECAPDWQRLTPLPVSGSVFGQLVVFFSLLDKGKGS